MGTTIAAVSSPPGGGLRGVIRVSGPDAADVVRAVTAAEPPARRSATATRFRDARGGQPCLLIWMPGPASYTREDVAEFHLPGAPPLLAAALERLLALGCVAAAPGEFTRRAFLNGRLDLTQAEGVLALVNAAGEAERRAATALLEGGLSARVGSLRENLEELRALCEASLDFDEADTGHVPKAELAAAAAAIGPELDGALAWEVRRQSPSALPRVVLVGRPNAGKSSLFNALVPDGNAIVSDLAGTTRDGVGGIWTLAGVDCLLLDAPGVDARARGVDAKAQELAARERAAADLLLRVVDATASGAVDGPGLVVWNKTDLPAAAPAPEGAIPVSAKRATGLEELAARASGSLGLADQQGGAQNVARELDARHRQALREARGRLAQATTALDAGAPLDLVAEELRAATDALDGISGRTAPEDLLDRIFARFCLGK